jgi:hypothetical protein
MLAFPRELNAARRVNLPEGVPVYIGPSGSELNDAAYRHYAQTKPSPDGKGRVPKYKAMKYFQVAVEGSPFSPDTSRTKGGTPLPPAPSPEGLKREYMYLTDRREEVRGILAGISMLQSELAEVKARREALAAGEGSAEELGQQCAALDATAGIVETRLKKAEVDRDARLPKLHDNIKQAATALEQRLADAGRALQDALHRQRAAKILAAIAPWDSGVNEDDFSVRQLTGIRSRVSLPEKWQDLTMSPDGSAGRFPPPPDRVEERAVEVLNVLSGCQTIGDEKSVAAWCRYVSGEAGAAETPTAPAGKPSAKSSRGGES